MGWWSAWNAGILVWSLVVIAACDAAPPSGVFVCVESLDCPANQRCYDGICIGRSPLSVQPGDSTDAPDGESVEAATAAGAGGAVAVDGVETSRGLGSSSGMAGSES